MDEIFLSLWALISPRFFFRFPVLGASYRSKLPEGYLSIVSYSICSMNLIFFFCSKTIKRTEFFHLFTSIIDNYISKSTCQKIMDLFLPNPIYQIYPSYCPTSFFCRSCLASFTNKLKKKFPNFEYINIIGREFILPTK